MNSTRTTITVDIVVYPGFKAMEAIGPMSVFEYANLHLQRRGKAPGYDVRVASNKTGQVRSDTLMSLDATKVLNPLALPDNAIIVGARHIQAALADSAAITEWVAAVAPRISRLAALCSGAFFLAAAGVLDGKRATTHWSDAAQLVEQFPLAQVEHDRIYVRDGGLFTSAGVTAGIDLALALVAEDHGAAVALSVAKRLLVVAQRQGGQSQFSPYLQGAAQPDSLATVIQQHVMEHLAESLSVERLAEVAGMSARNFARLFVAEMNITPAEFVQRARIDAARNLLEGGALALKTIAYQCGFGSAARMRLIFAQRFGVTPNQYRDSFRVNEPAAQASARPK